jgi:hypothetical protein
MTVISGHDRAHDPPAVVGHEKQVGLVRELFRNGCVGTIPGRIVRKGFRPERRYADEMRFPICHDRDHGSA